MGRMADNPSVGLSISYTACRNPVAGDLTANCQIQDSLRYIGLSQRKNDQFSYPDPQDLAMIVLPSQQANKRRQQLLLHVTSENQVKELGPGFPASDNSASTGEKRWRDHFISDSTLQVRKISSRNSTLNFTNA